MNVVQPEKVYVLWDIREFEENNVIGIFRTKQGAEKYRDEMIQELYAEEEVLDSDRAEYYIEGFYLGQ